MDSKEQRERDHLKDQVIYSIRDMVWEFVINNSDKELGNEIHFAGHLLSMDSSFFEWLEDSMKQIAHDLEDKLRAQVQIQIVPDNMGRGLYLRIRMRHDKSNHRHAEPIRAMRMSPPTAQDMKDIMSFAGVVEENEKRKAKEDKANKKRRAVANKAAEAKRDILSKMEPADPDTFEAGVQILGGSDAE